jgi:hypothetical protein
MKARAFGQFVVKSVEEKKYAFYIIRKLSVSHKEVNTVMHLIYLKKTSFMKIK